jgi:hypothetical protein
MSCYLRFCGDELDVIEIIETLRLKPSKVWEKGLPRFKSNPKRLNKHSGFNLLVSDTELNNFEKQKKEAIEYLSVNKELLSSIIKYKGIDGGDLDFGIEWRNVAVQCDNFPSVLIKLAGQIGLGIELSQYEPPDDYEDEI